MQIIFEFIRYGNYVKVSAMDTRTGIEAVVSAPAKLSQREMQDLARRKLIYVLKKQGY